ncbi:MAG: hypothetical protein R2713_07850 [Ilumatobacteraceae bacterium]
MRRRPTRPTVRHRAPAATDGATGDGTETEPTVALRSAIAFTSTSGTAFAGSITSFAVENVDDGTSDVVSVLGADAATRTEVEIAPGTYTVTPLGPSIAGGNMSLVEPLEPRTVTVDEPTADQPEQIAVVDFDVSTLSNPLRMRIESLTATTVDLAWDASAMDVAGVDASVSYVVRRTDGTVAATDPSDGEAVELLAPTAHRAVAVGLDPEHQYTFTVFAQFDRNGEIAEWSMSASATTAGLGAQSVAYALAPNTIVPTTFDELNAERLDETSVRITLVNGAWTRQSATDLPLVGRAEMTDHCMIGSPILVPTSIAGDEAFYGLIASCDDAPAGLLRADSTTAVVNTAVPLNAVFSYLDLSGDIDAGCYDFESTDPLSPEQCQEGQDTDGDGLSDATEARVGSDPNVADSDGDSLDDFTEVEVLGTDPLNTDSDFDSLPDGEGALYGTDPLLADSDGDGCWDTGELDAGQPARSRRAGGACVVPAGSPRWESNVDRTREIVRAGGPVSVPDTLGLTAPGGLATGNVQVIVLWASGDDLDVVVMSRAVRRCRHRPAPRRPAAPSTSPMPAGRAVTRHSAPNTLLGPAASRGSTVDVIRRTSRRPCARASPGARRRRRGRRHRRRCRHRRSDRVRRRRGSRSDRNRSRAERCGRRRGTRTARRPRHRSGSGDPALGVGRRPRRVRDRAHRCGGLVPTAVEPHRRLPRRRRPRRRLRRAGRARREHLLAGRPATGQLHRTHRELRALW